LKAVIQRVHSASVKVNGNNISKIKYGYLILLGIADDDNEKDIDFLVNKIYNLRIFKDKKDNMNLSIQDISGEALVVSQFTLCADTRYGRRPSFINAAPADKAEIIYEKYCNKLQETGIPVFKGKFGAMMDVELVNDGPVTIILDSKITA